MFWYEQRSTPFITEQTPGRRVRAEDRELSIAEKPRLTCCQPGVEDVAKHAPGAWHTSPESAFSTSTRRFRGPHRLRQARSGSRSNFLDRNPLLASIVTTAGTDSMRAAWVAAAWTRLNGDNRSFVVPAPLQFPALRSSSLGNCHCSLARLTWFS